MNFVKDKRGQAILPIISAIMIFMVGMLVVNLIKPEVTVARNSTNLDCGNVSAVDGEGISDGQMLTCLVADATIPYYMIIMLAAAGGLITSRFVGGKR